MPEALGGQTLYIPPDHGAGPMTERVKQAMAIYLGQVAEWRRRKADEFDRDLRNLRTARAL